MSIKVIGKPSCAPCQTLKYWLNKNNVSYEYEEATEVGYYPAVYIDGQLAVEGVNIALLKELLGI